MQWVVLTIMALQNTINAKHKLHLSKINNLDKPLSLILLNFGVGMLNMG
jgi:hypothetical protein